MVIGLLGILKAGAAYLPLDPAYPKQRLAYIVEHSRAPFLVTQERLLERLPPSEARVVCLDQDWDSIRRQSESNPRWRSLPGSSSFSWNSQRNSPWNS